MAVKKIQEELVWLFDLGLSKGEVYIQLVQRGYTFEQIDAAITDIVESFEI